VGGWQRAAGMEVEREKKAEQRGMREK